MAWRTNGQASGLTCWFASTPDAVLAQHITALNACDWKG
jgi:hypothetical protein